MNCPVCQHAKTKTIHSAVDPKSHRRMRQCNHCGNKFKTIELGLTQYLNATHRAMELAKISRDIQQQILDTLSTGDSFRGPYTV